MQHITACPVCKESNFSYFLSCKDYTVSHETFQLVKCTGCGFVMTSPRPDEKDLGKYYQSDAYISHSNKSRNLIDKVYKVSRMFTLKWKYDLVRKHSILSDKAASVLDFGCGTGAFLQECVKHKMKATGVEPSAMARTQALRNTSATIVPDIENMKDKFDVITLWHVLEHVSNLHDTVLKLKNQLKGSGTMFIAVPNLQSLDAQKYQAYWAGYDVPRHLWHFSKKTMEMILNHHGLNLTTVVPMRLDAYYVSLLSEKYKNGKNPVSNISNAIIQGWRSNNAAKTTQEYSSLIYIAKNEFE
jgi:2-polyprenyl-3-methyl-5-hydroxy-6-metoxy-1,4-benzoquinol methylase